MQIKSGKMSLRMASSIYEIPPGTLSNKVNPKHGRKAGHPTAFSANEEAAFVSHMKTVALWGFPFDTFDLRVLAQTYLNSKGRTEKQFSNNFPSAEWAGSFLKTHIRIGNKNLSKYQAKWSSCKCLRGYHLLQQFGKTLE